MAGLIANILRRDQDVVLEFPAGDIIFAQGSAGGDIFFIEEGLVDIFVEREGQSVVIGEMKKGEILGLMTFLNGEHRLASARAKTLVKARKVPHSQINRFIRNVPKWFEIVLKEFSFRIAHMNKKYFEATVELRKLKQTQADDLFAARQIASSMPILGAPLKISVDGIDYLVIDDIKSKLTEALNYSKERVEKIIALFLECGLLSLEVDKEKKRKVVRFEAVEKLYLFNKFVQDSRNGPTRKIVRAGFSTKEIRILIAMVRYVAKKENVDIHKTQKVPVSELNAKMQSDMRVSFQEVVLHRPQKLGLLNVVGEEDHKTIEFNPSELARTLACVDALKRLSTLKEVENVVDSSGTAA